MKDLSHFPKTDVHFWQHSIFGKGYTVGGQRRVTKEWYAQMQHAVQGVRVFNHTGTRNFLGFARSHLKI